MGGNKPRTHLIWQLRECVTPSSRCQGQFIYPLEGKAETFCLKGGVKEEWYAWEETRSERRVSFCGSSGGVGPAVAPPTNGPTPDRRPQIPDADMAESDETNTVRWLKPSPNGRVLFCVVSFLVLVLVSLLDILLQISVGFQGSFVEGVPGSHFIPLQTTRRHYILTETGPEPEPHHWDSIIPFYSPVFFRW
jgi:hypothetical protein